MYQKTYSALNPLQVPTILHAKAGSILASTDLVPHEETLNTRFHKEWLAPQGIIDAISVTFEKSALNYAMLAVHRHEEDGFVDDPTRRRMSLISPHCRRAVAIGRIIEDLNIRFEAAALADSLDGRCRSSDDFGRPEWSDHTHTQTQRRNRCWPMAGTCVPLAAS